LGRERVGEGEGWEVERRRKTLHQDRVVHWMGASVGGWG
jgi:hypothetical protein